MAKHQRRAKEASVVNLDCKRWGCVSLLVFGLSLLLTNRAGAVDVEDVVGEWRLSVARAGAIQLARLEIRKDSGELRAALTSELGDAAISDVRIEQGALLLRYDVAIGDQSEAVRLALRPGDERLAGTVSAVSGADGVQWPIQAAKVGSPSELPLLEEYSSNQSPVPKGAARLSVDEAKDFLGAWEVNIRRANIENAPRGKMGLIIADAGGSIAVGVKLIDGPQRTFYGVSKIAGGLRLNYEMNLGVTIPAHMDIVKNAQELTVTLTPPNHPPLFLGNGG